MFHGRGARYRGHVPRQRRQYRGVRGLEEERWGTGDLRDFGVRHHIGNAPSSRGPADALRVWRRRPDEPLRYRRRRRTVSRQKYRAPWIEALRRKKSINAKDAKEAR